MQVIELKKEGLDFHVKVVIPADKITSQVQKELGELAKKVKMDGFRPGKVPLSTVTKKYGESTKTDIIKHEINHAIDHVIKDHKLNLAIDPKLDNLKTEQDVEFTLEFELIPEIVYPDFKKISLEKPVLKIDDADIEKQIEELCEANKSFENERTGAAKKGDQVTIDAIGYVDEVAFDGGKLESYKLVLGSKSFIDTFEDQLVGSKVGDDISVKVTFPKEYHVQNLAGKPAEFKVQVLAIHKAEVPKADDEFAKKFSCQSIVELKERVSKNIESSFDAQINTVMKMNLFNKLEELLLFEVPKSLLARELSVLKSDASKIDIESDPILKGKSEKELEEYYTKLSLRRVRIGLMLSEYVKTHELKIEQSDIRDAVMSQARNFPGQEMMVIDFYQKNPKAISSLTGQILEEKAVKYILDNEVKTKTKEYSREKLEKLLEEAADVR